MHEKNFIDKMLDNVEYNSKRKVIYERVYIRPTKGKSITGFIFSLICFIALLFLFSPTVLYFILLISNILILVFFAINAFTEKGIGLPKTVVYEELPEDEVEDISEEYDNYEQEEYEIESDSEPEEEDVYINDDRRQ